MSDLINLITNNGIGVVCVAYLIYFQNTTMQKILDTLNTINIRLTIIEDNLGLVKNDEGKEDKKIEAK